MFYVKQGQTRITDIEENIKVVSECKKQTPEGHIKRGRGLFLAPSTDLKNLKDSNKSNNGRNSGRRGRDFDATSLRQYPEEPDDKKSTTSFVFMETTKAEFIDNGKENASIELASSSIRMKR